MMFRPIIALLLSYGVFLMANGLFTTLLGIRSSIEGFSTQATGLIMTAYFLGLFVGARYAISVVVLGGHIRAFGIFASLMSTTALVHIIEIDPYLWTAMRFVSGFCMAGLVLVSESWLNDHATTETRGQIFSLYMITNYAGSGFGQFLLPLSDPAGFHLFTVVSIIYSISLIPVLLTQHKAPLPARSESIKLKLLYHVSPVGMVGAAIAGFINSAFYSMGPVFARENGLSISMTSAFMAVVIFSGLLLQWPVGKLSDRVDRRFVLSGIAAATSVSCFLLAIIDTNNLYLLFICACIYGSVSLVIYSISAAHTNDFADHERATQTAGGLLVMYGIGAICGPVVSSQIMGIVGSSGLFITSATVTGLFMLFAFSRIRSRPTIDKPHKTDFIAIPTTQTMAEELYQSLMEDEMDQSESEDM